MEQQIRFCVTPEGVHLAYSTVGQGPALVLPTGWISHLELEWDLPPRRAFYEKLAAHHTVTIYDKHGCGLSDRERHEFTLEKEARDLEAVIDHLKLERFALLGISQGGPIAIAFAAKLLNKKSESLTLKSIKAFWRIPKKMRKTLTVDNGREFARFKELEDKTGLTVYFADPYSAWQRGTNENTNGRLRQYFPKGTDFKNVTEEDLAFAVKKLNHRPKKCLGYQSSHEVFWKTLNGALAT
jgi:pimeloyl-ACP methyl ester carboxylesterase